MSYLIRVVALAAQGFPEIDREVAGKWVESFDPEAYDGRGIGTLTELKSRALRYPTMAEALAAWHTQSRTRPLREDGKPNRPMTAYTVEIERDEVPEVSA